MKSSNQPLFERLASGKVITSASLWVDYDKKFTVTELSDIKNEIQQQLRSGEYCFHPVGSMVREGRTQYRWQRNDRIVINAIAMVLGDAFDLDYTPPATLRTVTNSIRKSRDYIARHPGSWLMRGTLENYHTRIDHDRLYQTLLTRLPNEIILLRLLWQAINIPVNQNNNHSDTKLGLFPENPLFPILSELYLQPFDQAFTGNMIHFTRTADEWLAIAPTRWQLEEVKQRVNTSLKKIGLEQVNLSEKVHRFCEDSQFLGCLLSSDTAVLSKQQTLLLKKVQCSYPENINSDPTEEHSTHWAEIKKELPPSSLQSSQEVNTPFTPNDSVRYHHCTIRPHTLWTIPLMSAGIGTAHAGIVTHSIGVVINSTATGTVDVNFDGVGANEWGCYGPGFTATRYVNNPNALSCLGIKDGGGAMKWDPTPAANSNEPFGAGSQLVNNGDDNTTSAASIYPTGSSAWYRVKTYPTVYYGWVKVSRSGTTYTINKFVYDNSGNPNSTITPSGSSNTAPALGGTFTTATIYDNTTTAPFSGVTVTDVEDDSVSISITYTAANGTLSGTGLTGSAGNYTLTSAVVATVQSRLRALVFTPTTNLSDSDTETTFTLTPNDGNSDGAANSSTKITASPVAPAVTSVSVPANGTYIIGSNLDFTVNADENVTVTNTPRLTLTIGSTTKYANYQSGSGSSALVFRYTVESGLTDSNGITLAGTIDLNATGTLKDSGGSNLSTTLNSVDPLTSVLVESVPPGVLSITRQNPGTSPTSADTLVWQVTFDQDVQNVDAGDFTRTGTTATLSVSPVSATVYDVTLSGGDLAGLTGTVTLGFAGGQNIQDANGNNLSNTTPSGTNEGSFQVDNTAPGISSFTRQTPATSPTNADTLVFRATFDGDVQNVDAADFAVNSSSTATITNVSQVSASIYDITVSGGDLASFNGSFGLNLAGGQNIADLAGNALPSGEPATDETYTLDNTAPGLTSITRQTPASASTNADTLVFRATFNADVQNVGTADFAVNSSSTATITNVSQVSASVYDITVSGGDLASFNGSVGINLAGGQDITDLAGNALPSGEPATDETYTLDNTAPGLTSITRQTPASATTSADTLMFRATFNADVQNVGTADFAVNSSSTAAITNVSQVSASVYDITVSGGDLASFNGSVGLNLAGGQNITDSVGNALPSGEPATDEIYTLDNTTPTIQSITSPTTDGSYNSGDAINVTVTFSKSVTLSGGTLDVTLDTGDVVSITAFSNSGTASATYTVGSGDTSADLDATAIVLNGGTLRDAASNDVTVALPATTIADGSAIVVDTTDPILTSIARRTPAGATTSADTLVFRVTFNGDVQNVDATDFTVNSTSTATITNVSQVSASIYDITVSGGDLAGFNGTVGLNVAAGQNITDPAGNALPAGEPATDETYLVDNAMPAVQIQSAPAGVNNTNPFSVTFKFSEDVTGFTVGEITVINGTATNFSGNGDTYTADITPDGNGDITIDVNANVAQDGVNNGNTAATQVTVLYDATAPDVEILNAPASVNNFNAFTVTFKFSENVSNFVLGDITVTNGSASQFSGSGDTYTADITPNANGDITIDVVANAAEDAAGNGNTAATQVTIVCGTGCNRTEIVNTTQRSIQNFIGRRMTNLTSDGPNLSGFLDGDGMGGGFLGFGGGPVGLNFSGGKDQHRGSFSTSLQQIVHTQAKVDKKSGLFNDGISATYDRSPDGGHNLPYSPANLWVKGRWSRATEDRGNIDEKSDFAIVYAGADYRFSSDLLLGVMGQFDWSEEKSNGLGVEAEGKGWMLGPYLVTRLTDSLVLDLRGTWGQSDNKVNPLGTYWDDFDTERWQLKGNLTGSFDYGQWHISPALGLSYFEETQKAYTDNNGFRIGEQTFSLGTLDFGPTVSYTYQGSDGMLIRPQMGVKGIWDFDAPDISDVNGIAVGTEGLRAQLKLGLTLQLTNGTSVHGSYAYDGIGTSGFESHTGELAVSIPLKLGVLPDGTILQGSYSLQSSSLFGGVNQSDTSDAYNAKLSVKIPLD